MQYVQLEERLFTETLNKDLDTDLDIDVKCNGYLTRQEISTISHNSSNDYDLNNSLFSYILNRIALYLVQKPISIGGT